MFKKIKLILKMKGYLKLESSSDIAHYLLYNYKKINIYDSNVSVYITSIDKDICCYTKNLNKMLEQDLVNERVLINSITEGHIRTIDIKQWYTDDGYILNNNDILETFLKNTLKIITWYVENEKSFNPVIMYNIRRVKPYYINLQNILRELLTILK